MLFGVIGHPIKHSLSPELHRIAFRIGGIDADYIKLDVLPERLNDFMKALDIMFRGINVTIPHKVEVMKYVDEVDELASKVGAVNTIAVIDGIKKGYNTDVIGIRESVRDIVDSSGKRVCILGAGGAARAAIVAFSETAEVIIFNRTVEKAERLAREFGVKFTKLNDTEKLEVCDIIINATPVGMDGVSIPIDPSVLKPHQVVVDMVYKPLYTPLLREAIARGCKVVNGLKMLVIQGLESEKIWLGRAPPWRPVYRELLKTLA